MFCIPHIRLLIVTICLGLALATSARAATIGLSAANFTNANQLSTSGSLVEAINFGNTTPVGTITVNGIGFASASTSSAHLSMSSPGASIDTSHYRHGLASPSGRNPIGITDTDANNLFDSLLAASGTGTDISTGNNIVTLGSLTSAHTYQFQLLLVDDRTVSTVSSRNVRVQELTAGNTTGDLDNTSNFIQLVTGNFTADATTQQFRVAQTGMGGTFAARLNAYQLRDISPDIAVSGAGNGIADGDATPSPSDLTNFGTTTLGNFIDHVFRVTNNGGMDLTTSDLTLPDGYSLIEGLAATIAPGEFDEFTVRLLAAAPGTYSGDILFNNNDPDAVSAFNFAITGTVMAPVMIPEPGSLIVWALLGLGIVAYRLHRVRRK